MSANIISLNILGKEYQVACPEGEDQSLAQAAAYLDKKMKDIRANARVLGADRIAVMAALNITHELLSDKQSNRVLVDKVDNMRKKIDKQLDPV